MESLPLDITETILCRLRYQLQCRQVCKTWLTLLPKPKRGLIYGVSHRKNIGYYDVEAEFYFSEQNNHDEQQQQQLSFLGTKLEPKSIILSSFFFPNFVIVGSCNGLVCYAGDFRSATGERVIYICNPITGEQIQAPEAPDDEWDGYYYSDRAIGFGYDRSSQKYKVVRVLGNTSPALAGMIKVYTLEGGAVWRNKTSSIIDKRQYFFWSISPLKGVLVGGVLYWMSHRHRLSFSTGTASMYVVAFDLETEAFELLPPIPCVGSSVNHDCRLMELGGNLCAIEVIPSKHVVTIWEFGKYKRDVSPWVTKFSIAWEDYSSLFARSSLTKTDDDKCLLWYNVVLSCYDPETKTLRKLDETLKKFMKERKNSVFTTTRATPHANSLVSLKAIMQKRKAPEKTEQEELTTCR